jgi:membrane-bound hydrogenase subunit mbhJ
VDDVEIQSTADESVAPMRHHAVWVLPLNMGSCNGCEQQIQAMLAPRYKLARWGISFATSPRHADIVLLTGALTARSLEPIQQVLSLVPDPHALIAVGDCAINGGIFAESDQVVANAADVLGVNIEITGSPPAPSEIIQAIVKAAELLDDPASDVEVIEETEEEADLEDEEVEAEK